MFNGTNLTMPVAPIAYTTDSGNSGNNGWGDGYAWIWILLIFCVFGGWGNGFGGFGGGNNGTNGAGFQGWATRADIQESFATNNLQSGITAIQQGICDATYALNNTMTNGFHNQTVATLQGFNGVQAGQNQLSHHIADCCCQTQRAIDGVNYNMATNTCAIQNTINNTTRDILENANANNRAILDFLVNDKIATLTAENQSLKTAQNIYNQNAFITANQEAQTAEIIRRLGADCPQPAYVVQPPTPVTFPNFNCCNTCGC